MKDYDQPVSMLLKVDNPNLSEVATLLEWLR